ncbi:hypothetical protein GCM10027167_46800 [Nocardia heshunensis]
MLGRGGMGVVYLARHPRLPRYDALKVLPHTLSADPEGRARFLREAELAARLDHPNIVAVWDRGVERGYLWIAMQFVAGIDADTLRRNFPAGLDPDVALRIVREAGRGLDAAHRAGMLHRDVKPANILLEDGPGLRSTGGDPFAGVYVSDFGIAKAVADSVALTNPGELLATLAYAAPERLTNEMVDHRIDVYALGCTLYELLTGAHPFPAGSSVEMMTAHLHAPPPRVTDRVPGLPWALDAVVARALAKDPTQRYSSCGELADAAATALTARPPSADLVDAPPSVRGRLRRWPRGMRGVLAAGLGSAVVAGIAFGASVFGHDDTGRVDAAATSSSAAVSPGPRGWDKQYQPVIAAFPGFLPASPLSSGYAGMQCSTDSIAPTTPTTTPSAEVTTLTCRGNSDPMDLLVVTCTPDRSPARLEPDTSYTQIGNQQWQRSSGQGHMQWGEVANGTGGREGALHIQFDDPARNFCELTVAGGATGQELIDRWWQPSPL